MIDAGALYSRKWRIGGKFAYGLLRGVKHASESGNNYICRSCTFFLTLIV